MVKVHESGGRYSLFVSTEYRLENQEEIMLQSWGIREIWTNMGVEVREKIGRCC